MHYKILESASYRERRVVAGARGEVVVDVYIRYGLDGDDCVRQLHSWTGQKKPCGG